MAAGALLALAAPSARAGEAQLDCGLRNQVFCGEWLYPGAGGNLTIHGTHWTWENGESADCTILTEEQRADRTYSVFRCVNHWLDGTSTEGRFIMLSVHDDVVRAKVFRTLYITNNDSLPCLFGSWRDKPNEELNRAFSCGYGVWKYEAPYSGWPVGTSAPPR